MSNITFGVIGNGFVGGATMLLECLSNKLLVYDIIPEKCVPQGLTLEDLKICDFIFVCVPTPMKSDGTCNLSIVKNVVESLNDVGIKNGIIIRSTVLPGTSDTFGCYFMPEFLTEQNYINDFINCSNWIIGCGANAIDVSFYNKYKQFINNAYDYKKIKYNNVTPMLNREAELAKYVRNSYLALKVSFFNEIHKLCSKTDISYSNLLKGVTCDSRIGTSHTSIPGPDGKYGYGGTCFPKDTNALKNFYESVVDTEPLILSAMIERNETIDRPEIDWKNDKRAFSD